MWSPVAQASFDALKLALASLPVLHTFDPCRRAVLTTDASGVTVAAILTQQDDEGHQHPVAYESTKVTVVERNSPVHVLELLAMVYALLVFKHYHLGSGAPRHSGCWLDFDLPGRPGRPPGRRATLRNDSASNSSVTQLYS